MSRVSLFAAALLAAPLAAAPVPMGPKQPDDPVPPATAKFLKYRKVQKELKMTAEQRINLIDALEDIEEDHAKKVAVLDKMPNAPDDAFDKLDKERAKAVEKLMTTTADKDLNATQRARLRQVGWQLRGPAAFADAGLQKQLQFTDAQKKKAADLAERVTEQTDRYLDALGDDDEAKVKAEVVEFRKAEVKKFVDAMTANQRDAWKQLVGEAVKSFDVDELWFASVEEDDLGPGR